MTIILLTIITIIIVFLIYMMHRATWGRPTREKAVAAELHLDPLKQRYPDAPEAFLTESFINWVCGQIDRDFPYETGADGLGPNGETGKKYMLAELEDGSIENLWSYDHALTEARKKDTNDLSRAERLKTMERYRQEKTESATDGNDMDGKRGRTVYYFKTDNCYVIETNMEAWLFSDHYVGLDGDGLDHKKLLESEGCEVVKLYPDVKEHEDLIHEICDYHGFSFNSIK